MTIQTNGPAAAEADVDPTVAPASAASAPAPTKTAQLIALLRGRRGATIDQMCEATGWQAHSVRGAISGALKKKLGLNVVSKVTKAGRVYRIEAVK
jgi:hypothetical protein